MSNKGNYPLTINIYKELKEDLDKLGVKDNTELEDIILRLLKDYVFDKNQPKPLSSKELNDLFDDNFWDD